MVRSTRARAVLAAGLVLGTGAVATLAAWTDQEYATGTFAAGQFDLEGAFTEDAGAPVFAQHSTEAAAGLLEFDLDTTNLSPGDTVQAPLAVRLAAGTTSAAQLSLSSLVTGTTAELTYGLSTQDGWGCATAATGAVVAAGTGLAALPPTPVGALGAGSAGAPGEPTYLCLTVVAGPGLTPGQQGAVTFRFAATSEPA